jgi:hypothetical protein
MRGAEEFLIWSEIWHPEVNWFFRAWHMKNRIAVQIASANDREKLVADIW